MDRSAPESGYDFSAKRYYRKNVWNTFRDHCRGRLRESHALLMPSAEGDEIDVALSKGFKEENLHVVDRNPAIVAHLKRRYPRINTYGVAVSDAAKRIAKSGVRLSVVNLDLCSPLSNPLLRDVGDFVRANPMSRDGALIAVTMLRGREQGFANDAIREARSEPNWGGSTDAVRLSTLKSAALMVFTSPRPYGDHLLECFKSPLGSEGWTSHLVRHDVYKSTAGSQTMLWAIFGLLSQETRLDADAVMKFVCPPRHYTQAQIEQFGMVAALNLQSPITVNAVRHMWAEGVRQSVTN